MKQRDKKKVEHHHEAQNTRAQVESEERKQHQENRGDHSPGKYN